MSAITKLAQGMPCMCRLPNICNFDSRTTVYCHLNDIALGHGIGIKVPDLLGFFGCSNCHDAVDGRRFGLSKESKRAAAHEAHCRTLAYMLANELITVKVSRV
jgi:hypothetical protein